MKKIKVFFAVLVVLCSASLFADDFDWSQCWCNYGAGIKQGDQTLSIDVGLNNDFSDIIGHKGFWALPSFVVDYEVAQPVWKLPFTFGGYAGFSAYGYKNKDTDYSYTVSSIYFGGIAAYHIMLPPTNLDAYISTKLGGILRFADNDYDINPFDLQFHEVMGASWYFKNNMAVNLELGYPMSKLGILFKF